MKNRATPANASDRSQCDVGLAGVNYFFAANLIVAGQMAALLTSKQRARSGIEGHSAD